MSRVRIPTKPFTIVLLQIHNSLDFYLHFCKTVKTFGLFVCCCLIERCFFYIFIRYCLSLSFPSSLSLPSFYFLSIPYYLNHHSLSFSSFSNFSLFLLLFLVNFPFLIFFIIIFLSLSPLLSFSVTSAEVFWKQFWPTAGQLKFHFKYVSIFGSVWVERIVNKSECCHRC